MTATCHDCRLPVRKYGFTASGTQRYYCDECRRSFSAARYTKKWKSVTRSGTPSASCLSVDLETEKLRDKPEFLRQRLEFTERYGNPSMDLACVPAVKSLRIKDGASSGTPEASNGKQSFHRTGIQMFNLKTGRPFKVWKKGME